MGYLLDTSMCVFFLRGKLNLDKTVKQVGLENCYISEITVAELRFGAENSDNPVKSNKAVDFFLKGLTILPIFGSIKRYAIEKVRLRKIGKPINDEFDLLIGVTAIENQLILVTDNIKDFKLLDGIQMENWFERN
ncbi:type II toxin-antitoxin system VapC family toxin [Flavobacterium sp. YJ01]|uniref:type II toxin-antitoxin system VapC family toxin n=1 Tax=unclassified Flavobacterium TaxID=196869 RepID=UPI0023E3F92F|nr:type II toxin-antitoxin system VapC family toxin [Flavobacterium sp. YJ01]WET03293.1 type II toxin-antitoxin system VapC family toxin [Flavobacterium sp. YJ01]